MIIKKEIEVYQCDEKGCEVFEQDRINFSNFQGKFLCEKHFKKQGECKKHSFKFIYPNKIYDTGISFNQFCETYDCGKSRTLALNTSQEWVREGLLKLMGLDD